MDGWTNWLHDFICHFAPWTEFFLSLSCVILQVGNSPITNWSERMLSQMSLPNPLSQDVPNPPPEYYTCHFRANKVQRYHVYSSCLSPHLIKMSSLQSLIIAITTSKKQTFLPHTLITLPKTKLIHVDPNHLPQTPLKTKQTPPWHLCWDTAESAQERPQEPDKELKCRLDRDPNRLTFHPDSDDHGGPGVGQILPLPAGTQSHDLWGLSLWCPVLEHCGRSYENSGPQVTLRISVLIWDMYKSDWKNCNIIKEVLVLTPKLYFHYLEPYFEKRIFYKTHILSNI